MDKSSEIRDNMSDLVKSENINQDIELSDMHADEGQYVMNVMDSDGGVDKGQRRMHFVMSRPKSGYLFPATLAQPNGVNVRKSMFNMRYYDDPHESLNKSFIGKLN